MSRDAAGEILAENFRAILFRGLNTSARLTAFGNCGPLKIRLGKGEEEEIPESWRDLFNFQFAIQMYSAATRLTKIAVIDSKC